MFFLAVLQVRVGFHKNGFQDFSRVRKCNVDVIYVLLVESLNNLKWVLRLARTGVEPPTSPLHTINHEKYFHDFEFV